MSSENPLDTEAGPPYEGPPKVSMGHRHGDDDGLALPRIVLKMEKTRRRYALRQKVEKRIADKAIPGKNIAKKIAHKARDIVRHKHAMNKKERQMALDLLCQMASLGMTIRTQAPLAQEFVSSATILQRAYRKHLAEKRRREMHEMVNDDAKLHKPKVCEGGVLKVQNNKESTDCPDAPVSSNTYFTYSSDSSGTSSESESDSEYSESSQDESELGDDDESMVADDTISESMAIGGIWSDSRNALSQTTRVSLKNLRRLRHACRAIGLSRKLIKQDLVEDVAQSNFRVVSFAPKEAGENRTLNKPADNNGDKAPARRQIRQCNPMGFGLIVASYQDSAAGSSRPEITGPRVTIEYNAPIGSEIPSGQSHCLHVVSAEAKAAGRKAPNRMKSSSRVKLGAPLSPERQRNYGNGHQSLLMPLDFAPQVSAVSLTLPRTAAEAKAVEGKSSMIKSAAKLTSMRSSKSCSEFGNDSASKALDSAIIVQTLSPTDTAQLSGKRPTAYLQQQGMPTDAGLSSTQQPQRSLQVNMLHAEVGELSSQSPRRRPMPRLWDVDAREPSSTIWGERSLPRLSGTGLPSDMVRSESSLPIVTGSLPKLEKPGLPLESSLQSRQHGTTAGIASLIQTPLIELAETVTHHQDGCAKGPWMEAAVDKKLPPIQRDGDEWPWPWPSRAQLNKEHAQPPKLEHIERGPLHPACSTNQCNEIPNAMLGNMDHRSSPFGRLFQCANLMGRGHGSQNTAAVMQGNELLPQEGAYHKLQHRRQSEPVRRMPALVQ